jgi:hypothetical protein
MSITIYRARRIRTMNPARPLATHVAVRDGLVLGAGSLENLTGWGAHRVDDASPTASCCRVSSKAIPT